MKLKLTFSALVFFVFFQLGCSKKQTENKSNQIVDSVLISDNTKGKLICYDKHKNFGVFKIGQRLECPFIFKNSSNESVQIVDWQASCNCTEIQFDKKFINPGDSLKVVMIINTKGKRMGLHSSTVIIKTNGERKFHDIRADFEIKEL